ncbi:MAG: hypothetical protein AB7U29_12015 [Desulfobulbus sp.]
MIKKSFYSLLEATNNTSIRPEEFIHLAAQGEVAISVWFKGVVVTVDQHTYHFKVVGYRDELMCLTPYEASRFLIKDTSSVMHLVDERHFKKYRSLLDKLELDKLDYDGCGKVLFTLEDEGTIIPEDCPDLSKVMEEWLAAWNRRLENQSPPRQPEPIADELFVQAGNMGDFIPATAGAIEIYDLDQDKFPVYAVDNFVISWKEMERLKRLYPPNHPPVTQAPPSPTAENNQENHSSPVQQHNKGEKVYGWRGT